MVQFGLIFLISMTAFGIMFSVGMVGKERAPSTIQQAVGHVFLGTMCIVFYSYLLWKVK